MTKVINLNSFKRSKEGKEYIENLSNMDLFDLTEEVIAVGRILKVRGTALNAVEKIRAKTLFDHVKGRVGQTTSLIETLESLINFYNL